MEFGDKKLEGRSLIKDVLYDGAIIAIEDINLAKNDPNSKISMKS